jgi:hypothetical protein
MGAYPTDPRLRKVPVETRSRRPRRPPERPDLRPLAALLLGLAALAAAFSLAMAHA